MHDLFKRLILPFVVMSICVELPPRDEGEERVPSFLSIDEDRRVLRFDSFSKVLSSGIRLGFMTGPKPLIDRTLLHVQVSVLHASSLSQVIISEMLDMWGVEGLEKHIAEVEEFYRYHSHHYQRHMLFKLKSKINCKRS